MGLSEKIEPPVTRRSRKAAAGVATLDEAGFLPVLVTIAKTVRALMGVRLAQIGFHNGQDEALAALAKDVPIPVSALAEQLGVRPSTISKMMDRLIAKEMVAKVVDTKDSRRTLLKLTDKGVRAQEEIGRMHAAIEEDLVRSLGLEDPRLLLADLTRLQNQLGARLNRLR